MAAEIESLRDQLRNSNKARLEWEAAAQKYSVRADENAKDVLRLQGELSEARETISRLNRRCQEAESAASIKVEDIRKQGGSFGRALAAWSAGDQRRKAEAAEAKIVEMGKMMLIHEQNIFKITKANIGLKSLFEAERARCAKILDEEGRRAMNSGAKELAGIFWSLEIKIKQGPTLDTDPECSCGKDRNPPNIPRLSIVCPKHDRPEKPQ